MDYSVLIIISIIILLIIMVIYSSGKKKGDSKSKGKSSSASSKKVSETPARLDSGALAVRPEAEPDETEFPDTIRIMKDVGVSGPLYIPPEMLGDSRDEAVRRKVDEMIRSFNWDADGGKSEFLYTFQLNKSGWICPYCEGENTNDAPICMICGTEIGA